MHEKILIVEDEMIVARELRLMLERAGYEVCGIARSVEQALEMIASATPFFVLLDIYLKGDLTGIDLAHQLNKRNVPFIYVSANSNQSVLESAKLTHPYGFIVKPFRRKDVLITLDIARYRYQQHQQMQQRNINAAGAAQAPFPAATQAGSRAAARPVISAFSGIVGQSASMQHVFNLIKQVAPLDTSVLIMGESGTGKEGIATAVHCFSARRNRPLIKVDCGTLQVHLAESELFGHEKGAFTGAVDKRIGKFEQASGGTLFLDEIGEMPLDLQVKLLRVLQEREIERIGGSGAVKVDVRIIAATNRNLEKEIAEGRFRLDLYYRLYVFPILVPALRERREDIPLLVAHFIDRFAGVSGKEVTGVDDAVMDQLVNYSWPGNVRELEHLIERSVLLSKGSTINQVFLQTTPANVQSTGTAELENTGDMDERERILASLKQCNGKISGANGAAALLQVSASTLHNRMKKLGIRIQHGF
ncbi:sigma-54-dependent transcriptional regulator [Deminuibacter soli]|uniref:Sigma-54-dependent Fis family transcriptional regulator n=1 Tax=Deminuibacter soli TaxID=2291815 RepID=A0A3E1NJY5_9BACT|nr:sigma-54 dependent transcriptional regulator [Deminuibacter soli]RFM28233.1 sigma-54-dependent Fis family transcriptional regulator [Deminuibacter soli]